MDWITENLLRQRKAWHALLTAFAGRREEKAAPERAEKDADSPASADGGAGALGRAAPAAGTGRRVPAAPPEHAAGREIRSGSALPAWVSRPGGRPAEPDGKTLRAELARRSERRRGSLGAAAAKSAVPAAELRAEAADRSPSVLRGPLLRARELSRTVERDARRYDGGFAPF